LHVPLLKWGGRGGEEEKFRRIFSSYGAEGIIVGEKKNCREGKPKGSGGSRQGGGSNRARNWGKLKKTLLKARNVTGRNSISCGHARKMRNRRQVGTGFALRAHALPEVILVPKRGIQTYGMRGGGGLFLGKVLPPPKKAVPRAIDRSD